MNQKFFYQELKYMLTKVVIHWLQLLFQVHGDAITCVKITDDVVFTASLDRTVKVWDRDMKQVRYTIKLYPALSFIHDSATSGVGTAYPSGAPDILHHINNLKCNVDNIQQQKG